MPLNRSKDYLHSSQTFSLSIIIRLCRISIGQDNIKGSSEKYAKYNINKEIYRLTKYRGVVEGIIRMYAHKLSRGGDNAKTF